MHRRRLLALLSAGLGAVAGCSTDPGKRSPSPDTVTSTAATRSPDPGRSRTPDAPETEETETPDERDEGPFADMGSVVDLETVDRTLALPGDGFRTDDGARVRIAFAGTATTDGPARIAGTFENANDFENTFRLHDVSLLSSVPSAWPGDRSGDGGYAYRDELYLAPTQGHDLAERVPTYERAADGRWRLSGDISGPWIAERERLDPGATRDLEYVVLGHPEGEGFPAERYEFARGGEASVTVAAWRTSAPGPAGRSPFEGVSVPALPDAEPMAWFHDAGPETTVYLAPGKQEAVLPATVEFTLVNHGRTAVTGNPYYWKLSKLHEGSWYHIAPQGWPVPLAGVPPGGQMDWTLRAFSEHAAPCDDGHDVGYLGGGRYAFEVGMSRDEETHAALLALSGPAVEIVPTDDVTASREGSTVRVDSSYRPDGERATLVVERADAGGEPLIPEQVMREAYRGLRNTLGFVEEGVDRVRLRTLRNVVSRAAGASGYEDRSRRIRIDGQSYVVRARF